MKRKFAMALILGLSIALNISGCGEKDKTTILTSNVKQEAAMQEKEIKQHISDGSKFLEELKYEDARSSFEKAISMDKANKGAYIEIKNKYVEKQRLDDAYYIMKLAISNNVDVENMTQLASGIKTNFEVAKIDVNIEQKDKYELPSKVKIKINNEDKEVDVVWNNSVVDTSKLGIVKYEGKVEQYDRTVELNLNVIKVERAVKIGYIKELYNQNGERILKFDEVEAFFNKDINDRTAENEAIKDGKLSMLNSENGRIYNDYYIRNKSDSVEPYKISTNVDIYVCKYTVGVKYESSTELIKTSFDRFNGLDINNVPQYELGLFNIYLENNVIVKIEEVYIP